MIRVDSEIGRLRRVLVHEPGLEVDRMVPAMMEQLLFDDILYGDRARDEHAQFRRVMQLFGVEVVEAQDLLQHALELEEARRWVIDVLFQDLVAADRQKLDGFTSAEMAEILVAGSRPKAAPSGVEVEDLYEIPPLPNWCFQRDPQVIVGDSVILASMAAAARHREGLLTRVIFRHHPELSGCPVLYDPVHGDHQAFLDLQRASLEGGDVLVMSKEVLVIGISERTNRAAVKQLARSLRRREGGPRWLVLVSIPRRRAYMHLDTLITPVDRDACLVYPPVVLEKGSESARVFETDLHSDDTSIRSVDSLLGCLKSHGLSMEPIACGGNDPVAQQREQWTDGANALALAPGVIALYARNRATADELERRGFRIVRAQDLLLGRDEADIDGPRTCVLLPSTEISRARGGPHCLVHPLLRDPV